MAKKMDAFSASLMADKREIIFAPTIYKFVDFCPGFAGTVSNTH